VSVESCPFEDCECQAPFVCEACGDVVSFTDDREREFKLNMRGRMR
jgi:hypothetical protein